MGVKVRKSRGKYYLDVYKNGRRKWIPLHLEITGVPEIDRESDRVAELCRAKLELQQLLGEYELPDHIGAKFTLYDYIEGIASGKGEKNHYGKALNHLADFPGGRNIRLEQITPDWLKEWQQFLLKKRGLSRTTAKHYDDAVRCALNQAVRERKISVNPAVNVKSLPAETVIKDVLTAAEIEKLATVQIPGKLGSECRRAFLFACYTGLRVSDLRQLRWSNIDDGKIRIVMSKTDRAVEVPLHPFAQRQLEPNKGDLVFPLLSRTRTNCIIYFDSWRDAAGVKKKIGWHTARRTFATLAVEAGVDQFVISKLLGHTSIRHTATYSQVPITTKRAAVAKLPDIE